MRFLLKLIRQVMVHKQTLLSVIEARVQSKLLSVIKARVQSKLKVTVH